MEQMAQKNSQHDTERVIGSGARLTIETIAAFVQLIQKGLAETTTVVIEFEPDVEMDITALQVFCSACRTAEAEGKQFIHRGLLPKALLDLGTAIGSERHEQCKINNEFCFRKLGGMEQWKS